MSQPPKGVLNLIADLLNKESPTASAEYGLRTSAFQQSGALLAQRGTLASALYGEPSSGPASSTPMWVHLVARFQQFLANLALTPLQLSDGEIKYRGVVSCLNTAYYGHNSETENAFLIGSWSKHTRIRPPRDVDLYFVLPVEVYHRFEKYADGVNKQSALLQEVKAKLLAKYGSSDIRGDGPVVLANFTSYNVEVVPAFALTEDRAYWVCDTKNGGRYVETKPLHEIDAIDAADARNAKNVRPLIRMLKAWQAFCNVPIKSFYLELLAIDFLDQSAWSQNSYLYYDWICRDFFQWMVTKSGYYVLAPGTYKILWLGDAWKTRAETAYYRAVKASDLERENKMIEAGEEWQKIFGTDIPRTV